MSPTDEVVFSHFGPLGPQTITLRRDRIVIIDKIAGEEHERHIQLSEIAESVENFDQRFWGSTVVMVLFAGGFFAASLKVAGPSRISDISQLTLGGLALVCLCAIYVTIQPVACARVRTKQGELLFEMRREKDSALPFEEFLLQLQRRLKALEE